MRFVQRTQLAPLEEEEDLLRAKDAVRAMTHGSNINKLACVESRQDAHPSLMMGEHQARPRTGWLMIEFAFPTWWSRMDCLKKLPCNPLNNLQETSSSCSEQQFLQQNKTLTVSHVMRDRLHHGNHSSHVLCLVSPICKVRT